MKRPLPAFKIMRTVYRLTLTASGTLWLLLGAFSEQCCIIDRAVFTTAGAVILAAAYRPTLRLRQSAVFLAIVAGGLRTMLLIGLQLRGSQGLPVVGAGAWLFVAIVTAAVAAFGWIENGGP